MSAANDTTASPTKSDPGTLRESDAKFINAVMQNLLGKLEFDTDKVGEALSISKKTVSNRWCDLRNRYGWGTRDNGPAPTTPTKPRAGANGPTTPGSRKKKADDANGSVIGGRVNKSKATPRKKKVDPKVDATEDDDGKYTDKPEEKLKIEAKPVGNTGTDHIKSEVEE